MRTFRYPEIWWGIFVPAGVFTSGILLGYTFMALKHWLLHLWLY
jgi:hypothetical protein